MSAAGTKREFGPERLKGRKLPHCRRSGVYVGKLPVCRPDSEYQRMRAYDPEPTLTMGAAPTAAVSGDPATCSFLDGVPCHGLTGFCILGGVRDHSLLAEACRLFGGLGRHGTGQRGTTVDDETRHVQIEVDRPREFPAGTMPAKDVALGLIDTCEVEVR